MLALIYSIVSRLQTSWTAMLLLSTRNQREKCSLWTLKASSSWCRSKPSIPQFTILSILFLQVICCRSWSLFVMRLFVRLRQVSQRHPRPHEGSGDGLAQTVPESRDPVPEWWDETRWWKADLTHCARKLPVTLCLMSIKFSRLHWFLFRTLRQVCVCTSRRKQRWHGQRRQLHFLPRTSH